MKLVCCKIKENTGLIFYFQLLNKIIKLLQQYIKYQLWHSCVSMVTKTPE